MPKTYSFARFGQVSLKLCDLEHSGAQGCRAFGERVRRTTVRRTVRPNGAYRLLKRRVRKKVRPWRNGTAIAGGTTVGPKDAIACLLSGKDVTFDIYTFRMCHDTFPR